MKYLAFGPAVITHNAVTIGRTYGGGALNFLSHKYEILANTYTVEEKFYGVEGTINLFEYDGTLDVSSSSILFDYGEIKFVFPSGELLLYRAKIFLPDSLTIGVNSQNPFTVRLTGGVNSSGKLFKIN